MDHPLGTPTVKAVAATLCRCLRALCVVKHDLVHGRAENKSGIACFFSERLESWTCLAQWFSSCVGSSPRGWAEVPMRGSFYASMKYKP